MGKGYLVGTPVAFSLPFRVETDRLDCLLGRAWVGHPRPGCGYTEGGVRWLLGTVPEWGREVEPAQGPWGVGQGLLTNDADTDSMALLGPAAGMGGHTAVGPLILRPHLREEQHWTGR